MSVEQNSRSFL